MRINYDKGRREWRMAETGGRVLSAPGFSITCSCGCGQEIARSVRAVADPTRPDPRYGPVHAYLVVDEGKASVVPLQDAPVVSKAEAPR